MQHSIRWSSILIVAVTLSTTVDAQAPVGVFGDTLVFKDRNHFDQVVEGLHEDSDRLEAFEKSLDFVSLRQIVEPLDAEVTRLWFTQGIEPEFPFDIDDPVLLTVLSPDGGIRIGRSYFQVVPEGTVEVKGHDERAIDALRAGERPVGPNVIYHLDDQPEPPVGNGPSSGSSSGSGQSPSPACRRRAQVLEYSPDLDSTIWGRVWTVNLPFYHSVVATTERLDSQGFQLQTDELHVQGSFTLTTKFCKDLYKVDFSERDLDSFQVRHKQYLGSSPTRFYKIDADCLASMHYALEVGDAIGFAFMGRSSWGAIPYFEVDREIDYIPDLQPVLRNAGDTHHENWFWVQVMRVSGYGQPYDGDQYWISDPMTGLSGDLNLKTMSDPLPNWFVLDPGTYRVVLGVGNGCTTYSEIFDWFTVQ